MNLHAPLSGRAGRPDLGDWLAAHDAPVGTLSARGHDLAALIEAETDRRVLAEIARRAGTAGDLHWVIAANRRLLAIRNDPVAALDLLEAWLAAEHAEEAAALLERMRFPLHQRRRRAAFAARVALLRRDFETAEAQIARAGDDAAWLGREAVRARLRAGQFAAAMERLDRLEAEHGPAPATVAMRVHLTGWITGAEAAQELLAEATDLLPPESAAHAHLAADLMLARGRYRECLDHLAAVLPDLPGHWGLYHLAEGAALRCDRLPEFGALLDAAAELASGRLGYQILRCNFAAAQGDIAAAEALLPGIRTRSEWDYRTARLNIACQSGDRAAVEAAHAACADAGMRSGGPEQMLATYLYFYAAGDGGLTRAHDLVAPLRVKLSHDADYLQTLFRLQIGLGRHEACRAEYEALPPGLAAAATLAPFAAHFMARDGDHEAAVQAWTTHLARSAPQCLNADSSYPETVELRYRERPGDILAFATVFNAMDYIEWFLDYYRKLGVAHFFITDNGSDDGGFELLRAQPDVSLFSNPGSFAASGCGVFWANHLLRRFGVGHWCLHLDIDEALVFPGMDAGRSLAGLAGYLDRRGFASLPALMLDIYPETLDATGENPFVASRFIDTDYVSVPCEIPPYRFVQGGVRARLTGRSLMMTKAPMIRMRPEACYIATNHQHSHLPVADVSGALLHYKFVGDLAARVEEAVDREEHFLGARFYKALRGPLARARETRLTDMHSVPYEGPAQLVALGLMHSSENWDREATD